MAIVVMVDQSGSMSELISWNGVQVSKAVAVSEAINNLLEELVLRSRSESVYRHYYDIMVVGYSGASVVSLLETGDTYFITPAQLMGSVKRVDTVQRQRRLPDGRSVITSQNQRIWVDISSEGRTPMKSAFDLVLRQLKWWCSNHPDSFPPLVINISDGEATDAGAEQLIEAATQIKGLEMADGKPLMMSVHLSTTSDESILFPLSKDDLPGDRYAELLFELSSMMPEVFASEIAQQREHEITGPYCAMAYNASMTDLVKLLNIGSTTINHIITL